jgi:CHAT domain-containing protein/predicted negative regulator of RcsB-dependent stress response
MKLGETAPAPANCCRVKDDRAGLSYNLMVVLLSLIICPMMKAQTPTAPDPAKQGLSVNTPPRGQPDAQTLKPENPLEDELVGGKTRKYLVELQSAQLARIVVEQRGLNVALRVSAGDGTLIARADEREDTTGNEQVIFLAESAGIYQLEIQAVEEDAEAGHYVVQLAELRAATPRDRLILAAEKVLLEANRLLLGKTVESRRLAIKKYEEAAALLQQSGERERAAFAIAQIGMVHGWMGETQAARDNFNRALELQRESNNRTGEARVLTGLGHLFASMGEWQKALDYHRQALGLRRGAQDRVAMMVSLDRIGEIYEQLGEPQRALEYYNQALSILDETSSLRLRAKLLGDIGQVYETLGAKQEALEHYERALALRRKRNNRGGMALILHRIGLLKASSGDLQTALERHQEALKIQQTLGNIKAADTLTSIGEIYYRLGDRQKALDYLRQSSVLRLATTETPGEALTRYWVARVRRDEGDLTGALKEIEAAVGIVENLRSKLASQELRTSYFATVEGYYDFYIDLLMQLHSRNPSSDYQEAALAVSERARARSLLELLREARADIRRGVDPALLERERSFQRQLNAKAEEQSNLPINKRTEGQAEQVAKELESLTTGFLELETQIRQKSPRYAALTQPRTLNLKEIQGLLDPQTLLLEYKLGETRSYLWVVTRSAFKSFELPKRAEVEAAARHLYELLTERNRQTAGETLEQRQARFNRAELEYGAAAMRLSQMLISPVASLLEQKRLVIVSDGALHYIPFAALPAPETQASGVVSLEPAGVACGENADVRRKAPNLGKPLIVDHEVINLPSASVLSVLRETTAGRKQSPKSVAVLADPVFDEADARVSVSLQGSAARRNRAVSQQAVAHAPQEAGLVQSGLDTGVIGASNFIPRLPFSRREAAAILASAPAAQSKVALDFGANRDMVMGGELAQYRYIHFATHGLLNSSHPELSGVVLSLIDEHGRRRNGFLRLNEIYNLELPADLIVLSACRTGLGKEVKGEGLVGLTRGFMYAGAARVTATLWKVDDSATAELMGRFYSAMLKNGRTPSAALRQAQIEMAEQKRWHSPYYWAAFTMQGDWQ